MNEAPSKPLITTIIPTYRRPKLLRRAIGSVLAQTCPHFQVCVYDNASGDETASVVAELAKADSRVKYYCHRQNIGSLRNFIYGMERVETPFFSLLSDDDVLLPEFYQRALNGFEKFPQAIFSALATIQMDERGRVLAVPILNWRPGFYPPPEGLLAMLKCRHPEWTGILFRREVLEKAGFLDEETGAPSDLDFELRIAGRLPIAISREPGAIFVAHSLSTCCSSRFDTTWPVWLKMIGNLTADERIAYDVRTYAEQVLTERVKRRLIVSNGFGSMVRRNWQDAFKAAEVLRNYYHLKGQALLLRTSARACQHFRPAYYLLLGVYALRRLISRFKNRHLQREYGAYARLLGCDGEPTCDDDKGQDKPATADTRAPSRRELLRD